MDPYRTPADDSTVRAPDPRATVKADGHAFRWWIVWLAVAFLVSMVYQWARPRCNNYCRDPFDCVQAAWQRDHP